MTATSVFKTMAQDGSLRDGSLRGITGPLVKIPLDSARLAQSVIGSATISTFSTGLNADGSSLLVNMSVPASVPGMAVLRSTVYGRVVGIRFRRTNVATNLPFDVVIDGVAYPVDDTVPRRDNQALGITDYESTHIVAAGLADRVHTVEVQVAPDPALAQTNTLIFLGFLGERGRGYNEIPAQGRSTLITATTLTTTAATIAYTSPVAGLSFHNTDAASRTVTVYGPDGVTVYKVLTVAAGGDAALTFPTPRTLLNWKWKADAGSVVTGWVENS